MNLSEKQKEYWNNANHRWNIKAGATRSGKTYLDYFMLPKRILNTQGTGLIVILGNTKSTIERNILNPMRAIYGHKMVGSISNDNTVKMFGKKVYALGAEKKNRVDVLRGSSIEYCYGDEVTTWHKDVFDMLKSRLDNEESLFDGTCNPEGPKHWFKEFLDSDADIFQQHYSIDDNPFLPVGFVKELKKEYAGTILFNRYILGQWVRAEGIIYRNFADNPTKYKADIKKDIQELVIGVDYGGNKSKHSFVATSILSNYRAIQVVASEIHDTNLTPTQLNEKLMQFIDKVFQLTGRWPDKVYPDNAEQVLIRGMRSDFETNGYNVAIQDAWKTKINDRINLTVSLIGLDKFSYTDHAETVKDALCEAVYDEKTDATKRLDDGTTDIDTLDAFEYSIERATNKLIRRGA